MLGQGKKEGAEGAAVNTVIGQHSRVEGDIHFSGSLQIDGAIKGNIIAEEDSSSVLTVSEHGSIEGNVQVAAVILNGTVNGDIRSGERIELAAKAKVNGDVYYHLIEMAMGAEVNGSLIHGEQSSSSVLAFGRDVVAGTSETQE
jgi:cytoskeletal protein CcmA (bactofilin family)